MTIFSIILQSTKIKYYRPKQRIISANLLSATNNFNTFTANLEKQIAEN